MEEGGGKNKPFPEGRNGRKSFAALLDIERALMFKIKNGAVKQLNGSERGISDEIPYNGETEYPVFGFRPGLYAV